MNTDLKSIAGDDFLQTSDPQRMACVDRLTPVIGDLLKEGMPPAAIVTALAELTVHTLDRQRFNN